MSATSIPLLFGLLRLRPFLLTTLPRLRQPHYLRPWRVVGTGLGHLHSFSSLFCLWRLYLDSTSTLPRLYYDSTTTLPRLYLNFSTLSSTYSPLPWWVVATGLDHIVLLFSPFHTYILTAETPLLSIFVGPGGWSGRAWDKVSFLLSSSTCVTLCHFPSIITQSRYSASLLSKVPCLGWVAGTGMGYQHRGQGTPVSLYTKPVNKSLLTANNIMAVLGLADYRGQW